MVPLDPCDTIAAVSSPPGFGFRGVVRLSGPSAWPVALAGFAADREPPAPRRPSRVTGSYRLERLRPPLPASLLLWPGPRTYTGQPLAEIHTVGAPPLLQLLLAHCLMRGARVAEPGEFTLRAFLSGRIDLTRAEAVLGVIDARSPAQLDAALGQLAGGLASPIVALRDRLLDALAHLEANLDFVDEPDVNDLGRVELAEHLLHGSATTASLADRLRGRDRPDAHPTVVLVGPPNAGKSRLFNALLGQPRALVSPQPGTTRDYLSALLDCDGIFVVLVDTAGEETASSSIDALAQSLRADQAARADLLLDCMPADASTICSMSTNTPALRVLTKSDLATSPLPPHDSFPLTSSATGRAGLETPGGLAIASTLAASTTSGDLPTTTGARCRESLDRASLALATAAESLANGAGDELVSVDLRHAIDELGKVVGAVVTDDILDLIFRRFCIGK